MRDSFSESPFCTGLKQRFVDDRAWENTDLHRTFVNVADQSSDSDTPYEWYKRIDDLYETICTEGYRTQYEIAEGTYRTSGGFGITDVLANEITVDIGRDGTLQFVDGKHRLAIAKILDCRRIPVSVAVRHKKWIDGVRSNSAEADRIGATDWVSLSERL